MLNLEYDNDKILKLLEKAKNSIGTSTLTIDNNILRAIGFEGIQYILQNKVQFSGMLDNVDSIKIDYLNKDDFDDFKEFILSTPPLQYIQLDCHNCYDNHITSLSITSGVEIKFSANDTLIKNFYSQVKDCDANNLSNDDLAKFVKNACNTYNETKSTNNKSMQYLHTLKILINFDFTAIDQLHSNLKDKLKSIIWITRGKIRNLPFTTSLRYHDQDLTETYVAFVANKISKDHNKIDQESIEMFMSMMTSNTNYFLR